MKKSNNTEEKKRYLMQYLELKEEVEREAENAGYWQEKARGLSSPDLSTYGIHSSSPFHPLDKFLEIAEVCAQKGVEMERKKREIQGAIDSLADPVFRRVLKLKYIDGKSFYAIAEKLHYALGYVYRVHKKAIQDFAIPET